MTKKILVPTDNSKQAEKAGEHAIEIADLFGEIILLYVIDTDYLNELSQPDLKERLRKKLKDEGKQAVENFRQKLEDAKCEGKCKNVELIPLIKEGVPADVILKTIEEEEIDQVIIGKSGKSGITKLLIGSTANKVIKGSKAPVNVIS